MVGTVTSLAVLRLCFAGVWSMQRAIFDRIVPLRLRRRFGASPALQGT
jgi:hypothetical protein